MDVSIIYVNYKTGQLILDSIYSVKQHTITLEYEIIVVDNHSEDGSAQLIKDTFPEVIVLELDENLGFGRANNKGLKVASGNLVFFLNPDTILINPAINILAAYLMKNPNVGACGGNLVDENEHPVNSFGRSFPSLWQAFCEIFYLKPIQLSNRKSAHYNYTGKPLAVASIVGADLMVRKSVLEETGAFDPDFFMNFEETELCERITRHGYRVMSVPEARIIHLEGKSPYLNASREQRFLEGQYIYYTKRYGANGARCLYRFIRLKCSLRQLQFSILCIATKKTYWRTKQQINKRVFTAFCEEKQKALTPTFVTLFPASKNVHLLKDVGMIPYVMYREYGYDAKLVCFKQEEEYPALRNEVKGLKIHFLEKEKNYSFGKISFTALRFLFKNARRIDVLNLYHNTKETLMYGLLYRICNPNGVLYMKLDINIAQFDKQKEQRMNGLRMWGYRLFFRYIPTLVSCELPESFQYIEAAFPALKGKILLLTNGVDDVVIDGMQPRISAPEKENIVLTVGRIGAPEKNNEMLLQALQQIDLSNWKVVFAGPVEPVFAAKVDDLFKQYPRLCDRVILTGNITDRNELYSWYNRAKVFCLTSRFESFGIVFAEALYFGNYIITTPVSSSNYITDNGRLGKIVQDEAALVRVLQDIVNGALDTTQYYDALVDHSTKFRWKAVLAILDQKIKESIA